MNTRFYPNYLLLIMIVTVFPFTMTGCAHQQDMIEKDPAASKAPAPSDVNIAALPQTVEENGTIYRIDDTPFGIAKTQQAKVSSETKTLETTKAQLQAVSLPVKRTAPETIRPTAAVTPEKVIFRSDAYSRPEKKGGVTINFDEADLYEVIRTIAQLLEINYMVDANIKGKVTIHTTGVLDKADLLPLFFQILETNGLTAVKEGPLYKIGPIKDASRMPISARLGKNEAPLPPNERVVLQIIPLKNIDTEQMVKILTPFISAEGTIISHAESNTILIVDKGNNILRALKLVEAFDVDLFSTFKHRFYKIAFNSVEDIVGPLKEMLTAYSPSSDKDLKVIAITHLNMILVLSKDERVFDPISKFIETLDTPNKTVQPALYVYSVKNGEAEELSGLLTQIFTKQTSSKQGQQTPKTEKPEGGNKPQMALQGNPFAMKADQSTSENQVPQTVADSGIASGTLRGEIKITSDKIRNALIIEAIPSDYRIIQDVLSRLDVLPRQVLIEAMIAEITLDDTTKFGVEWAYQRGDGGSLSSTLLSASLGSTGLNSVIGQTDRWSATLSALASESKVNILSAPTVLASNDKAASINISTEVPVASASYEYANSSSDAVVTTNIEYRNTGIILSVTPHINENGLVSMDVKQEVSEQAGDVTVAGKTYPSFFQRAVNTTLTVGHNQTIVIGGLIRENKSTGKSGAPIISKIPIIGSLFGTDSRTKSKSELIILLTPRVIVNLADVETVTSEFKSRVPNAY